MLKYKPGRQSLKAKKITAATISGIGGEQNSASPSTPLTPSVSGKSQHSTVGKFRKIVEMCL